MDQVQLMLGDRFVMLYHPGLPPAAFIPQQTLQNSLETVNQYMDTHGRNLSQWEPGMQDEAARLVNVNVIYQNLPHEPIRKPILAHWEHHQLIVDCGDTRLMALNLCENPPMVSAIITVLADHRNRYNWQQITCDSDLLSAVGMDPNTAGIYFTPADNDADYAVSWLELGDASTAHHLHDIDKKLSMLQQHLDQQPVDFKFTVPWIQSKISWNT